jgi:hypothetical protein
MTVTMRTWEHKGSQPTDRLVPFHHAQRMALAGGFHRVQILTAWDEILMDCREG